MAQGAAGKTQQSGHTTESSTIISIGELMQMEQHRIDEEKRRREHQRLEHEAALRAARLKREQEAEERCRAEEQARRAKQEQEAQEAAELAGRMLGFISQAKVQAEHEASALAREAEHRRAMELERAKVDARIGLFRSGLVAVCVAAVIAIGGLVGVYAGITAPAHERQVMLLQTQLDEGQRQQRATKRELETQRDNVQTEQEKRIALENALSSASQRVAALEQQLTKTSTRTPTKVVAKSEPPTPPPSNEPCPRGDPMCGRFDPQ